MRVPLTILTALLTVPSLATAEPEPACPDDPTTCTAEFLAYAMQSLWNQLGPICHAVNQSAACDEEHAVLTAIQAASECILGPDHCIPPIDGVVCAGFRVTGSGPFLFLGFVAKVPGGPFTVGHGFGFGEFYGEANPWVECK